MYDLTYDRTELCFIPRTAKANAWLRAVFAEIGDRDLSAADCERLLRAARDRFHNIEVRN